MKKSVQFSILILLLSLALIIFVSPLSSKAQEIGALSAIAVDAQTGKILYGKNPELKLPPASTTKLVTAMVALDNLPPDRKVRISEKAANTQSVSPKLQAGEVYTVNDLIYLALMRSVNSAAVALAEAVSGTEEEFVKLMNKKAKKIGASNTKFANASGLPGKVQHTTVYDLTKIISHALNYPLIKEAINTRVYMVRSENGTDHLIQNTNQLLWSDDGMIGGKTGYTRKAKHCFVCASKVDGRLVYTALLGGNKREELWQDTQQLLSKANQVFLGQSQPEIFYTENKPIIKAAYSSEGKVHKVSSKTKFKDTQKAKTKKSKKSSQKRKKDAKTNRGTI